MTNRLAGEGRGDGEHYVITLCTASLPMVLRVPFVHELVGFSVFRSRTVEDGRERFRLYVGYFDSATRAHEALAVVRKHYPSAWISAAPRGGLGSLDDTMNTAFRMIRRATASVVGPSELPPPVGAAPAAAEAPPQRYVVQLDWSVDPVPSAKIPQLAVLRAYNLYRALLTRDDGPHHALRLGFFKHIHGAQQVAEYVRVHFPRVSVVPISHREFTRAVDMLDRRAARQAPSAPPADATARSGNDEPASPRGPQTAASTAQPAAAGVAPLQRSREQLLALLGADQLEVEKGPPGDSDRDPSDGPAGPPRAPRKVRSW